MKKLIAVVTMALAFTVSAQAQDSKAEVYNEAAKKDVAALLEKISLEESLKRDIQTLMVTKYKMLANAKSPAEKEKVSAMIEHKIMAGISKEQQEIMAKNPELMKQLSH